ncbi:MAG TPA: tetratricopeptide repeat protein [Opitutaceae bacterium]
MSADKSLTPRKNERRPRASWRTWRNRAVAAFVVPAALFLGLEGALRLAGYGQPFSFLIPDSKPGYFRTNPDFVSWFLPGTFDLRPLNFRVAARKPPDTVRIVVLGESAAQGIPAPPFGFAAQLRAQLRARYPGKGIEVINTGIVAINSHVVYQIAREMAKFSPDLYVVYMGNNEVVGPYGPGCAYLSEMPPLWVIRLSVFVRSTRTGQLVGSLIGRLATGGRKPAEWGGMSMFVNNAVRGDDPRLGAVYQNFEANLRDIVRAASGAGAKTLLCTVVSNLKDCAPLLSLHQPGLAASDLDEWGRAFNRGRIEWLLGKADPAMRDLLRAQALDPHYADTAFLLGTLELQAGDTGAARRQLCDAEHWDALRFRPDAQINEIIRNVARSDPSEVALLDAALTLGSDPASTVPPAGREILFEHVHFDWDGNYELARAMAEGSERALFGPVTHSVPWLDSAGCAAALAYTAHERLPVLQRIGAIVENPPFTNQLTYCEDEARLARDVARARADKEAPGKIAEAKEAVRAAIARDPENADLAKIAEEVDDDQGDIAGALAQAKRGQELQPYSFALATDQAIKLSRLGRYGEAEKLLRETEDSAPPRDAAAMAPAFADLFTRTRRFEDGRRYLDAEIARRPADESLRLLRGRLARLGGDTAAAEREFRALLAQNPGSQGALEALIGLLDETGQRDGAEKASLEAVGPQPRNLANNLRASIIFDSRGDAERSVDCLLAAEKSGPLTTAVELQLAHKLFGLQRLDETLAHLAVARRISLYWDDPAVTNSITEAIDGIWARLH